MPIFVSKTQLYRMIQRELPEGAFPDGAPSAFFATADSGAAAKVYSSLYSNLERIYANFFVTSADEKLADFEELYLGMQLDGALLTVQQRRDRVIAKIRKRTRTTPFDMKQTVYTIINSSIPLEIVEWGCEHGGWVLDESQLDIETFLNAQSGLEWPFLDRDFCSKTASDLGLTEQQLLDYREEVYTYEVRIYGYTLTSSERAEIDAALNSAEPTRSRHIIVDAVPLADMLTGVT